MDRYDVIVNGVATTLLLSAADAAARGLTKTAAPKADAKAAPAPANKSRKPANKAAAAADKGGDN